MLRHSPIATTLAANLTRARPPTGRMMARYLRRNLAGPKIVLTSCGGSVAVEQFAPGGLTTLIVLRLARGAALPADLLRD